LESLLATLQKLKKRGYFPSSMKRKNEPIPASELQGVYTAIITPFKRNGDAVKPEIDHDNLAMLIEDQIAAGIDGIVAAGTTGQSATLTHEEHVELVHFTFDRIDGRTRLIASAGSNSTYEAIDLSNRIAEAIGPTTFLHVTGYYNNPPQEGLLAHYTAVASNLAGGSNIILYNVPSRTNSNIDKKTVLTLSSNPKIIGIKQAIDDMRLIEDIRLATDPSSFRILSGEDGIVASMIYRGAYGVISASANVAPKHFLSIVEAGLAKDREKASLLQAQIRPLVNAVFSAKNPIPLAYLFNTAVRLPLVDLEMIDLARKGQPSIRHEIDDIMSRYTPEQLGIDLKKYKNS